MHRHDSRQVCRQPSTQMPATSAHIVAKPIRGSIRRPMQCSMVAGVSWSQRWWVGWRGRCGEVVGAGADPAPNHPTSTLFPAEARLSVFLEPFFLEEFNLPFFFSFCERNGELAAVAQI